MDSTLTAQTTEPPARTALDWLLDAVGIAALVFMVGNLVILWPEIPDEVPRHFNAAGEPDRWGAKSGMFLLPGVAAFVGLLTTFFAGKPQWHNLPDGWDRNDPAMQALTRRMVLIVRTAVVLLLTYLSWGSTRVATGGAQGLGIAALPVGLAMVIVPLIYYFWRGRQLSRGCDLMWRAAQPRAAIDDFAPLRNPLY